MMVTEILALTPEQLAVSPGAGAFAIFFVLAVALVLLALNMSKHLRKVDRHRIEEEVRAEMAAKEAALEENESAETGEGGQEPENPTADDSPQGD